MENYDDNKCKNKQTIYDDIPLLAQKAKNLYSLMYSVKDNPFALLKVKEYIDNNQEQAINSIFGMIELEVTITEPVLRDFIKKLLQEVMKNENVNFSDITFASGLFSMVLIVGNKVIKIGEKRFTKSFPNNPYIIVPLLRKEIKAEPDSFFIEVTERVDTSEQPSREDLYQLYKNLRNLGLIWTDIKASNVGKLIKDNIIHWNEELNPTEDVLELKTKRGSKILKAGNWVILDSDFIYDENDPNICYVNNRPCTEFEERYQREKKIENGETILDKPNSSKQMKNSADFYEDETAKEKQSRKMM